MSLVKPREILGIVLTGLAIAVIVASFVVQGTHVSGNWAIATAFMGFIIILLGPWLWLGETPVAVKKFIEARTSRKLEVGEKR